MNGQYVNIAAYKFVALDDLADRKARFLQVCNSLNLKGTILLSLEGINLFLSGTQKKVSDFVDYLRAQPEFSDIPVKESPSDHQPHSRMLVRLKKEIISMGVAEIKPEKKTSARLEARDLKRWLDEGKELTMLDVRNDYEVEVGTFHNALPIGVDSFREFPAAVDGLSDELKQKPLVMFCTGGIRCEKAGPLMEEKGFEEIYQLDGGILKYFEDCGGDHYDGDCFVFDKRVAVNPQLEETEAEQCYLCQAILTADDQQSDKYVPAQHCPYCYMTPDERMQQVIEKRNFELASVIEPLPGSMPYDNLRPVNVPLRLDHRTVIDMLDEVHPHLGREYWLEECQKGRIVWKGQPLAAEDNVRSGWRLEHLIPHTVEPDVNAKFKVIYEDEALVVVDKSAPLPMHPCGRFNRNSLSHLINELYSGEQIRICHRLDANTSGVVVCCRKKSASRKVQPQFENGTVTKTYLAEVHGSPAQDRFTSEAPISSEPGPAGARTVDPDGLQAHTDFEVVARKGDTTVVRCYPKTGRTNQIRVHLWDLGHSIVGDPLYLPERKLGESQTLSVDCPPMRLHALRLELKHPVTDLDLELESPSPSWSQSENAKSLTD